MASDLSEISDREREILQLAATGATNQQIAHQLHISVNTVKVHLRNINSKTGAASRTEAILYAVRRGWVSLADEPGAEEAPATAAPAATIAAVEPVPPPAPTEQPADVPAVAAPAPSLAARTAHLLTHPTLITGSILAIALVIAAFVLAQLDTPLSPLPSPQPVEPTTVIESPWHELAAMPAARADFAFAAANYDGTPYLYVIGGALEDAPTDSVLRYDTTKDSWVEREAKPTAVSDVQAVVVGSLIYVPGGRLASGEITATFEAYDPRLDDWQALHALPAPRSSYALAAVEGKIYLFGGWDGTDYRADVWQYDPDQDSWTERTAMPTMRAFASAAVLEERVYVLGGANETGPLDIAEVYFPAEDAEAGNPWTTPARLPEKRSRMAAAATEELIFLFGGQDATSPLLVYNSHLASWDQQTVPLEALYGLRAEAIGNRLYILGGRSDAAESARLYVYQATYTVFVPLPLNPKN